MAVFCGACKRSLGPPSTLYNGSPVWGQNAAFCRCILLICFFVCLFASFALDKRAVSIPFASVVVEPSWYSLFIRTHK